MDRCNEGRRYGLPALETTIVLSGRLTDAYLVVDPINLAIRCNVCGIILHGRPLFESHLQEKQHHDKWQYAVDHPQLDPPNTPMEGFGPPLAVKRPRFCGPPAVPPFNASFPAASPVVVRAARPTAAAVQLPWLRPPVVESAPVRCSNGERQSATASVSTLSSDVTTTTTTTSSSSSSSATQQTGNNTPGAIAQAVQPPVKPLQTSSLLDKFPDEPLIGGEYMVQVKDADKQLYVCMLCSRWMNGDDAAIAHLICPTHRLTYLNRFFPRAFERLGGGLMSGRLRWTTATFDQLRLICQRIERRWGRLAPLLVTNCHLHTSPLELRKQLDQRTHFSETDDLDYSDLSHPFSGKWLSQEEQPTATVGSLVLFSGSSIKLCGTESAVKIQQKTKHESAVPDIVATVRDEIEKFRRDLNANTSLGQLKPTVKQSDKVREDTSKVPVAKSNYYQKARAKAKFSGDTSSSSSDSEIEVVAEQTHGGSGGGNGGGGGGLTGKFRSTFCEVSANSSHRSPTAASASKGEVSHQRDAARAPVKRSGSLTRESYRHQADSGSDGCRRSGSDVRPAPSSQLSDDDGERQWRQRRRFSRSPRSRRPEERAHFPGRRVSPEHRPPPQSSSVSSASLSERLAKFRQLEQVALERLERSREVFDRRPEDHPRYDQEWATFWKVRHAQLSEQGVDADSYNYTPEWKLHWEQFAHQLFVKEKTERRMALLRQYNLAEVDGNIVNGIEGGGTRLDPPSSSAKSSEPPVSSSQTVSHPSPGSNSRLADLSPSKNIDSSFVSRTALGSSSSSRSSTNPRSSQASTQFSCHPESVADSAATTAPRHQTLSSPRVGSKSSAAEFVAPSSHTEAAPYTSGRSDARHRKRSVSPPPDCVPVESADLASTLRVLAALEDQLGSFAAGVNALLTLTVAAERRVLGSSRQLLLVSQHALLLDTVRAKLMGQLAAGVLLAPSTLRATRQAVSLLTRLLQEVPPHVFAPPLTAEEVADRVSGVARVAATRDKVLVSRHIALQLSRHALCHISDHLLTEVLLILLKPQCTTVSAKSDDLGAVVPSAAPSQMTAPSEIAVNRPLFSAYSDLDASRVAASKSASSVARDVYQHDSNDANRVFSPETRYNDESVGTHYDSSYQRQTEENTVDYHHSQNAVQYSSAVPKVQSARDFHAGPTATSGAVDTFGPGHYPSAVPAIDDSSDSPQPITAQSRDDVTDSGEPAGECDDELSVEQIYSLLQNFDSLTRPEQEKLMEYLKNLETVNSGKVSQLKLLLSRKPIVSLVSDKQGDGQSGAKDSSSRSAAQKSSGRNDATVKPVFNLSMISKEAVDAALRLAEKLKRGAPRSNIDLLSMCSKLVPSSSAAPTMSYSQEIPLLNESERQSSQPVPTSRFDTPAYNSPEAMELESDEETTNKQIFFQTPARQPPPTRSSDVRHNDYEQRGGSVPQPTHPRFDQRSADHDGQDSVRRGFSSRNQTRNGQNSANNQRSGRSSFPGAVSAHYPGYDSRPAQGHQFDASSTGMDAEYGRTSDRVPSGGEENTCRQQNRARGDIGGSGSANSLPPDFPEDSGDPGDPVQGRMRETGFDSRCSGASRFRGDVGGVYGTGPRDSSAQAESCDRRRWSQSVTGANVPQDATQPSVADRRPNYSVKGGSVFSDSDRGRFQDYERDRSSDSGLGQFPDSERGRSSDSGRGRFPDSEQGRFSGSERGRSVSRCFNPFGSLADSEW